MATQQASLFLPLVQVILQLAFLLDVPSARAQLVTLNVNVPPGAVTEVIQLYRDAASIPNGEIPDKTCGQNVRYHLESAGKKNQLSVLLLLATLIRLYSTRDQFAVFVNFQSRFCHYLEIYYI